MPGPLAADRRSIIRGCSRLLRHPASGCPSTPPGPLPRPGARPLIPPGHMAPRGASEHEHQRRRVDRRDAPRERAEGPIRPALWARVDCQQAAASGTGPNRPPLPPPARSSYRHQAAVSTRPNEVGRLVRRGDTIGATRPLARRAGRRQSSKRPEYRSPRGAGVDATGHAAPAAKRTRAPRQRHAGVPRRDGSGCGPRIGHAPANRHERNSRMERPRESAGLAICGALQPAAI
jgi:hypothetical protein